MIRIMLGCALDFYGYAQLDDTDPTAKIEIIGYDAKEGGPAGVRMGDVIRNMLRNQRLPGQSAADLLRSLPAAYAGGYNWAKDVSPPPGGHERSRAS